MTFNDALNHVERMRSNLPAIYNPARIRERPIPRVIIGENELEPEDENSAYETAEESIFDGNSYAIEQTEHNETFEEEDEIDVKPPILEEIQLTSEDAAVFDSMFSCESNDPLQSSCNDENNDSDSSSDVEYIFTSYEEWPKPIIENEFQIKAHDMLSNNRPFKQNVRNFLFK